MIRVIIKEVLTNPSGEVDATRFRTFDLDAPLVEAYITEDRSYTSRSVIGVEVLDAGLVNSEGKA